MIRRSIGITVIAVLLTLFAVPSSPATAASVEHDHATPWSEPSERGWLCTGNRLGGACFAPKGEWFQVSDGEADGYSVVSHWRLFDNYGRLLRSGKIWFSYGHDALHGWENKSFPEGHWILFDICRGNHSKHVVHTDTCTDWRQAGTSW